MCLVMESLIICKEILRDYFFASMIFKSLFEDEHLFVYILEEKLCQCTATRLSYCQCLLRCFLLLMLSKITVFGHTLDQVNKRPNTLSFTSHCCSKSVITKFKQKNPNIHFPD